MVRIRLRRVGRKKQPSYRIVVADKRSPRDGRYIEIIGFYNPRTQPHTMTLQEERALYWLSVGGQPSEAVERIFKQLGTLDRFERLKQGVDIEKLVAEAEAEAAEREPVSPKTEYPAISKDAKAALTATRVQDTAEASTEDAEEEIVEDAAETEEETVEDAVTEEETAEETVEEEAEAEVAEAEEEAEAEAVEEAAEEEEEETEESED